MTVITKRQVKDALAEFRVNRRRDQADNEIRRVLRTFGNGANSIGELKEEYYEGIYRAAGGFICSAEEFYGTVTDVPVIDATKPAKITITPLDVKQGERREIPSVHGHVRVRSPLTLALEAELAKTRAKTKRSVPNRAVNIGNASRPEDQADDVVRDFPAGERMS